MQELVPYPSTIAVELMERFGVAGGESVCRQGKQCLICNSWSKVGEILGGGVELPILNSIQD